MAIELPSSAEVNSIASFGHSQINGGIDWNEDELFALPNQRMSDTEWYERFGEQARRFVSEDYVNSMEPLHFAAQVPFENVFGEGIRKGTVKAGLDPFIKRWCIYMKRVSQYGDGCDGVWERAITICKPFDPWDPLPEDLESLNADGRLDHWAGRVGEYKVPTEADFRDLRRVAEIRNYAGKTLDDVKVAGALAREKWQKHQDHYAERRDFWYDFFGYYKTMYRRAWGPDYYRNAVTNGGTFVIAAPGGIADTAAKAVEAENWNVEQRDGYTVRTRKPPVPARDPPRIYFDKDGRRVVREVQEIDAALEKAANDNNARFDFWRREKEEAKNERLAVQRELAARQSEESLEKAPTAFPRVPQGHPSSVKK